MSERTIVIIGLPESGKTTFLAALWHEVTEREIETMLSFESLGAGDRVHLNQIAARWREAKVQDRTALTGDRIVSMNLKGRDGQVRLIFPDVAGEKFRDMWEKRECDSRVADYLGNSNVLLFIHADTIRAPRWIVDINSLAEKLGLAVPSSGNVVPWHPRLAPTQVVLVDLLQTLQSAPLDVGPRRLAIMLSAWDKVEAEGLSPLAYLETHLPLLMQYLSSAADPWTWRVYGVSSQGCDYDRLGDNVAATGQANELRNLERPSDRIRVLGEAVINCHDLTEPLAWLME